MQMKLYCSKCGSTLKVESVTDFSNPNEVELRVTVHPCSECASQQSAQRTAGESAPWRKKCAGFHEANEPCY